jgi:hypothetical protein
MMFGRRWDSEILSAGQDPYRFNLNDSTDCIHLPKI